MDVSLPEIACIHYCWQEVGSQVDHQALGQRTTSFQRLLGRGSENRAPIGRYTLVAGYVSNRSDEVVAEERNGRAQAAMALTLVQTLKDLLVGASSLPLAVLIYVDQCLDYCCLSSTCPARPSPCLAFSP